ncbi:MAG TPA: hypothetical protein VM432_10175, partial [Bdellovibrionales bacterium]|nr:hypothetical protein [Bdellovibrionales bacterium]
MKKARIGLFTASLFLSAIAIAQTDERSLIRFSAVVQYSSGNVERVDNLKHGTPLAHESVIYEGDRIQLAQGSTLKLVTRSRCILVLYGTAVALAPNAEKPWRAIGKAARLICPSGASETFVFNRKRYHSDGGELLIADNKVIALRANVSSGDQPLKIDTGSQAPVWQLSQKYKAPKEATSIVKPTPEPAKPNNYRLSFGPVLGSGAVSYNSGGLSHDELQVDGARLQLGWRHGEGSLLAAIFFREQENRDLRREKNQ